MGTRSNGGYKLPENRPTEPEKFPRPPKLLVLPTLHRWQDCRKKIRRRRYKKSEGE